MNLVTYENKQKIVEAFVLTFVIMIMASCDLRSGIARDEEEKFNGTPTPTITGTPTDVPIVPADILQVDTSLNGDELVVNGTQINRTIACDKYNAVNINGNSYIVTIKGACRQIIVNGDNNKITVNAATRFVLNGDGNTVGYLKFVNGSRPSITNNGGGNVIEKVSSDALTNSSSNSKPAGNSSKK